MNSQSVRETWLTSNFESGLVFWLFFQLSVDCFFLHLKCKQFNLFYLFRFYTYKNFLLAKKMKKKTVFCQHFLLFNYFSRLILALAQSIFPSYFLLISGNFVANWFRLVTHQIWQQNSKVFLRFLLLKNPTFRFFVTIYPGFVSRVTARYFFASSILAVVVRHWFSSKWVWELGFFWPFNFFWLNGFLYCKWCEAQLSLCAETFRSILNRFALKHLE